MGEGRGMGGGGREEGGGEGIAEERDREENTDGSKTLSLDLCPEKKGPCFSPLVVWCDRKCVCRRES